MGIDHVMGGDPQEQEQGRWVSTVTEMVINQILRGALRSLWPTLKVDTVGYRAALTHSWPLSLSFFALQLLQLQ